MRYPLSGCLLFKKEKKKKKNLEKLEPWYTVGGNAK